MNTILLVEDNPHILRINAEVLGLRGYEVLRASTAAGTFNGIRWTSSCWTSCCPTQTVWICAAS